MTDFLNKHRKSKLLRACSPGKFFWILGFLSYSDNNYIYWLHVQTIFNLESFPFFLFFNLLWKIWPMWIHAKVQAVLISPWLLIWSSFYEAHTVKSSDVSKVKLTSLYVCVFFFFTFANWFTALRQIKDGPIGTLVGCGQEVSPYLALILFDLDLQDLSDILLLFAYRGVKCPFNFTISNKTRKFIFVTSQILPCACSLN